MVKCTIVVIKRTTRDKDEPWKSGRAQHTACSMQHAAGRKGWRGGHCEDAMISCGFLVWWLAGRGEGEGLHLRMPLCVE